MSKLILRQIYGTGVDVNLVFNKICKCQRFDSFQTAACLNKKNALIPSNRTFDNKTRYSGYYHIAIRGCLI